MDSVYNQYGKKVSLPFYGCLLFGTCVFQAGNFIGGAMHFCVADSLKPEDRQFTKLQFERFSAMLERLAEHGVRPEIRHCCSSGATLLYPEYALDMDGNK